MDGVVVVVVVIIFASKVLSHTQETYDSVIKWSQADYTTRK